MASSIQFPPSPTVSPCLSPSAPDPAQNPEGCGGTQQLMTFADDCPLSEIYLEGWNIRYNRRTVPLMDNEGFRELVVKAYSRVGTRGVGAVEAEVACQLQSQTAALEDQMDAAKIGHFLDLPRIQPPFDTISNIQLPQRVNATIVQLRAGRWCPSFHQALSSDHTNSPSLSIIPHIRNDIPWRPIASALLALS